MSLSNKQLVLLDTLAYFFSILDIVFLPVAIVSIFKQTVFSLCL